MIKLKSHRNTKILKKFNLGLQKLLNILKLKRFENFEHWKIPEISKILEIID